MATACASELFVGLAVFMSDWNSFVQPGSIPTSTSEQFPQQDNENSSDSASAQQVDKTNESQTASAGSDPSWTIDIEDLVVDFWNQTTTTVKRKLRRAYAEMVQSQEGQEGRSVEIISHLEDEAHLLD